MAAMTQSSFLNKETNVATSKNTNQEEANVSGKSKNSIEEIPSNNMDEIKEFVRLGRTGRRNAIADVNLDPNMSVSTNTLSELMCKIDCGSKENQAVNN